MRLPCFAVPAFSLPTLASGLLVLCLLLSAGLRGQAIAADAPGGPEAESADAAQLVKSPNDERSYRYLELPNRLKVLLVSDPDAEKAAASLDVLAGSNSDPDAYPGLAHFLEHMLFLGTERFPEAGEYQAFIASHGGSHNAYTAFENTNYYFDIETAWLEPALERFSQFFVAPLFNPQYVERERNAVHSEYVSNLQDDGRRSYSILKAVMNPEHPLTGFSVGSLETLSDAGDGALREALLAHYDRYYSANLMSLAVLGPQTLDELEAMVRGQFAAIPDRDRERPATDEALFREGDLPAQLAIRPVRELRTLSYTFPIPVIHPHWRAKPLNYLANLLGHEGEGSLHALLRERGWANALSAGPGMSYRDNATFSVSLTLTEDGLNQVDAISALLFEAIELIGRQGIEEWRFEEQRRMAEISFLFQEPSSPLGTVGGLAQALQLYPPEDVLVAGYLYEDFDPALLRDYLGYLRPDNVLLTLTAKSVETDQREPLFGGEYSFAPLAPQRLASWESGDGSLALALPEPNPFLPEDLALKPLSAEAAAKGLLDKPELILDEGGVRLWFRQDNVFRIPRANFYLYAMSPLFEDSLEHSLLATLVISLVNDELNAWSYPARLAGVFYGIGRGARGYTLNLGGYQDKQPELLDTVLATFAAAEFDEERFNILKAEMLRSLRNAPRQTPYVRLQQRLQAFLVQPSWSEEERSEVLSGISFDEVRAFAPRMLENLSIDALYHGNVLPADALAMMEHVRSVLQPSAEVERPPFSRIMDLPPATRIVQEVEVEHDDSAIVMYLQAPDQRLETRATVSLLGTVLRTPFYDTLRTERQLGYVVNAGAMSLLKTSGLIFTIESPGADPLVLEDNILGFLGDWEAELAAMPEARFADIRAGLLNNLRQSPQRLNSLSNRFWNDITLEEYEADSVLRMADAVEALEKADLLAWYRRHVLGEQAAWLVARSAGRPHLEGFLAALQEARDAGLILQDESAALEAFKAEAEFFHYSGEDSDSE